MDWVPQKQSFILLWFWGGQKSKVKELASLDAFPELQKRILPFSRLLVPPVLYSVSAFTWHLPSATTPIHLVFL